MHYVERFAAPAVAAVVFCGSGAALGQVPAAAPAVVDEEGALDPARPAPAGKGVVWGVVTGVGSADPLMDSTVTVLGTKHQATADIDGRFRLVLPPGTYELRVWFEGHKAQKLKNVRVLSNDVARVDIALLPDQAVEDVIEVEVAPERASAAAQLVLRKNAAHVGDAVGAQEIAKTPDKNAADASKRVVGATVVGGKYVFVRGLGDRYSNALLNGTPLPSPEPDRQAVPLDLFPAVVLSDITIVKTFTPDMPGDFAGGSVRVGTRELPERFVFQATLSAGINTQSTFAERPSYEGSSLDWLGIDGGARALPSTIPSYKVVRLGPKPNGATITPEELTGHGRALNSYMSTKPTVNLPNLRGSAVVGDGFKFGGGQELGAVLAATYGRGFSVRKGEILRTYGPHPTDPGSLRPLNDYTAETGLDQVQWGTYASLAYKPGKNDKLAVTGLHSRAADDEARIIDGYSEERQADLRDTRLRFVSRSLTFGHLTGTHKLPAAGGATLDWQTSLSFATTDEPDTRETVYVRDASTGQYAWDRGTLSGSHLFNEQRETGYGGGLDWTQPLATGDLAKTIKVGGLFNRKARGFDARRFRYIQRPRVDPAVFNLPPDELFTRDNIGTALELEEYTRANDSYTASQDVYAGYVMTDMWLSRRVRLTAGARVEASRQAIDSFDPFAAELTHVTSELSETDLLPSVGLVFKTTSDSNLRATVSRTVARPQLRELSLFAFTDYFGAREVIGNPALERTSIYNADLRFELFPGTGEVLAASAFYKHFDAPIETVIVPSGAGMISYQNAKSARLFGGELEARKSLGFITPTLRDLGILGNLTLVSSSVELDAAKVGVQTNNERPLAGQSPYVINAGLDYSNEENGVRARLLYNVFGPRIAQVGSGGLPDVYEKPRHQLDLTVAYQVHKYVDLKLSAENMLDSPVLFTQGVDPQGEENIVNKFRTGTTVSLGVAVSN